MNGKAWTADDTATLKRMASAGYSDGEIAQHLGRRRAIIQRKRASLTIRSGINPALTAMMARINARHARFRLQF